MDLQLFSHREFEILVGLLLKAEGFKLKCLARDRGGDNSGPDFQALSPTGKLVFVEVKHFRKGIPRVLIRQFAEDIERYRDRNLETEGLLVTSSPFTSAGTDLIHKYPGLAVWSESTLQALLEKHPHIAKSLPRASQEAWAQLEAQFAVDDTPVSEEDGLIARLAAVRCGRDDWRRFEDVGVDLLTKIFTPELGPPEIQSRSSDGLDILDAIFPIRAKKGEWHDIRGDFSTRFVVAEFKNYSLPIGQKEVEAVGQYLWKGAKRMFAILVSRQEPSESALTRRRAYWVTDEKMIIFLCDQDLQEMLSLRQSGGDPAEVVQAQIEDFLRTLSP